MSESHLLMFLGQTAYNCSHNVHPVLVYHVHLQIFSKDDGIFSKDGKRIMAHSPVQNIAGLSGAEDMESSTSTLCTTNR